MVTQTKMIYRIITITIIVMIFFHGGKNSKNYGEFKKIIGSGTKIKKQNKRESERERERTV